MKERIEQAAQDLVKAKYAVALTGAGISTESGVPDFRGPDGLWTKDPEAERQAYLIYGKFLASPAEYWEERLSNLFLRQLSQVKPNPGHYALTELEQMNILKSIMTQNIDNLHLKAGSQNVLEYHGNAFKLRCLYCHSRYSQREYELEQLQKAKRLPPRCRKCGQALKSDIVYFQEPIPEDVATQSHQEARKCDLMLICGTSATVYPFASLPSTARSRRQVTIIEINDEPTSLTGHISDYLIQGKTGEILPQLVEAVKEQRK